MYSKGARYITNHFIKQGKISEEKANVYAYGFEILISTIIYTIIFLITATISGTLLESFLFWIGFFIVRTIAGGYHAKSYISCHILFMLNHIAFIAIVKLTPSSAIMFLALVFMLISTIILFIFAPVDHPNKRFTENEQKRFRISSLLYALLILLVMVLAFMFQFHSTIPFFSYTIGTFSATTSIMASKIIRQSK